MKTTIIFDFSLLLGIEDISKSATVRPVQRVLRGVDWLWHLNGAVSDYNMESQTMDHVWQHDWRAS